MPGRRVAYALMLALGAGAAGACGDANAALERVSKARQIAGDLFVQFVKAADAANRAVMADTDESSVAFAHEAEAGTQAVQADVVALRPMLDGLGYTNERRVLDAFDAAFSKYLALDRTILDLAVENTNLKAQRLSFGPAQADADVLRRALGAVVPGNPVDAWRVKALGAAAVAAVREIQVLQAPHIAEPNDAAMTRIEAQMATEDAAVKQALATLAGLASPAARPQLAAAGAALDRFAGINAEILRLSHRNTNVRSLALSLDQKRALTAACEDQLRALRDALATRGVTSGR